MASSNQVAFSIAALSLSGIAILNILRRRRRRRRRSSRLEVVKGGDCGVQIKEGEDFISQLPDDLLLDILFRLPTRDSVRTSILSKRWRSLYASVPLMDISCHAFPGEPLGYCYTQNRRCCLQENFTKGVDSFFRLHSVSGIYSCRLSCALLSSRCDKLWAWVYSLGRFNIKVLHLDLVCCDIHDIVAHFDYECLGVTCEIFSQLRSLEYFYLRGDCHFSSTSEIIRPNGLKVLDLDRVSITPQAISCLLLNCLNLEGLFMEKCTSSRKYTLRICGSNLRLKCLVVKQLSDIVGIELRADNLECFEYFGYNLIKFSFEHIPKLERFVLSLPYGLDGMGHARIAKSLPSVPILSLHIYGQYHEMCRAARFNMLRNVRHLLLGFSMFKPDRLSIASVLRTCPVLCEFQLQVERSSQVLDSRGERRGKRVSLVFHDQLKKVIFTGFSGMKSEMEVVEYLMRSALFLEKMIISYCFSQYVGRNKWIKNGQVSLTQEKLKEIETLGEDAVSKNVVVIVQPIYLRGT